MKTFLGSVVILLALGISGMAQTAKVIALEPGDSGESIKLHQAFDEAKKAVDAFDEHIRIKYTMAGSRPGWSNGIEYSDDWLFLVPKQSQAIGLTFTTWPCGVYSAPASNTYVPMGLISGSGLVSGCSYGCGSYAGSPATGSTLVPGLIGGATQ